MSNYINKNTTLWICISMFMLSFNFVVVCGLFEWKWICACFFCCLFISVLLLQIQLSRGLGSIDQFSSAILSYHHKPKPWFPTPYVVVVFLFVQWFKVIVCYGGIVDHHYLNFISFHKRLCIAQLYWWTDRVYVQVNTHAWHILLYRYLWKISKCKKNQYFT